MSGSKKTISWETIQQENDGKVFLQLEGEQLYVKPTDDGKMKVAGADGNVKFVSDIVSPVDPKDPKVIEMAKLACAKNNVKFASVISGVKVNVLVGTVYCLIISGTDSTGASKVFFAAIFESILKTIVLFFAIVAWPF